MSVLVPSQCADIPAWNRWFYFLDTGLSMTSERTIAGFKKHHRVQRAFVIALWESAEVLLPTMYLRRYYGVRSRPKTLKQAGDWAAFDSPTEAEDPVQWKTPAKTLEVVRELRKHQGEQRVGIVYWLHPEGGCKPEDYYLLMDGFQLPGSTAQ